MIKSLAICITFFKPLYRPLLLCLVCCIQLSAQAQTRIEIPADSQWSSTLIDELEVLSDEERRWTADLLFDASDDLFQPNPIDVKPILHNYWARFVLANTTKREQWVSFESYYWDYVTLYFRDSTGHVAVIPFGILSNPNDHKFLVPRQAEFEVIANFESSGQFRRESNINLVIKPTLPALEEQTFTNYMDGIILGIIFGLALYNLFLFISLRDKTYFWYSLYILSFAFSFATLFASEPPKWTQFFTPDYPSFAFYIKKIADPIAWIGYTNFVRNFLSTKHRHPIWDKVLKVCIVLIIIQFLINLSGLYLFSGVSRSLSWNIPVAVCVMLAIMSYYKGYIKSRFFIVGQLFLVAGIIITTTYYAGLDVIFFLPDTAFFNYFRAPTSVFVFVAVESIIFSFALADKYNILQRDIARVKIEKEKQKQDLLASQNVLLEQRVREQTQDLRIQKEMAVKEKDRSESLLLNILPADIAMELKEKGEAEARNFEMISILFTDFKDFTAVSENLSARELVVEINACFEAFDGIMDKYNIEKIKTIGDAYMAAGGLPIPFEGSVKSTVLAAIEMQAFITKRKAENDSQGKPAFVMRAGIHTGTVVAGIVGVKKFQYDVWGDTVNTASRIESSGGVGKVNISQVTYDLLKDDSDFKFESRGKIEAKGKGEIEMYFVSRN